MSLKKGAMVGIIRVEHRGGYRLSLEFSDGHVSDVDFGPFLTASLNPVTCEFLAARRFRAFRLVDGNLVWGDYELCFPIEDLYKGEIGYAGQSGPALAVAEGKAEYGKK